jgi:hypothetical protein
VAAGVLKFSTIWLLPLSATLFSTAQMEFKSSAGFFFSSWNVKSTSLALNGVPSLHFTPLRMVKVSVRPAFDQE